MAQGRNAADLLARIVEREVKALEELYNHCAPGLLGMVLHILGDRNAAEEILQDVFLRLWSEARRWSPGDGSLDVWLTVVARRAAVDRLRARLRAAPLACASAPPIEKSPAWLPRAKEIARLDQRRDLLKKLVNQLPNPQRQSLELAVFGGYTEQEIAGQLGEPLGKVRTELRAAMTFLRHRLRAVSGTWAANI